ncbi:hypothetical protein VSR82_07915 [Burkholderia sp. JPY481]
MDEITEGRLELLESRLDFHDQRLDALESAEADESAEEKHAEGMRLNWLVVALFVLEVLTGAFQVWWGMHHA